MAQIKELKNREKSINKINKITNAMKLVSFAKSQQALKKMFKYKPYYNNILKVMSSIQVEPEVKEEKRNRNSWIIFTSDMGLAGGYNIFLLREFLKNYKRGEKVVIIGTKGKGIFQTKFPNEDVTSFSFGKGKNLNPIILNYLTTFSRVQYEKGNNVNIIFTEYKSQINYYPRTKQLLPIQKIEIEDIETKKIEYDYEPNPKIIFDDLIEIYLGSSFEFFYRQAAVSELISRRVAMENASSNGGEIIKKLRIEYNKARQSSITQEINEISSATEALND